MRTEWIRCPVCGKKTRDGARRTDPEPITRRFEISVLSGHGFQTVNPKKISCGSCYVYAVVVYVVFGIYDIHLICPFPKKL